MAGEQSAVQGDIQSAQAPRGQEYGQAGAQLDAQSIIPVAGLPSVPSHSGSVAQAPPGSPPGSGLSLGDPSIYPGEPLTAGLSTGPGAGPEALTLGAVPEPPELAELRAVQQVSPSSTVRRLIEWTEANL